jgi:hypothetical protein
MLKEKIMSRISIVAVGIALIGGAAAVVMNGGTRGNGDASVRTAVHAGDVAFRDGMFHGRLQAQRGETPHLTAGRWSRDSDRQLFVAGYQEGYMQERGQAITVSPGAEQLGYREGLEEGTQDRRSGRAFRLSPDAAKAGPRVQDRQNYAQGYASGYQLSYYGTQEVTDALVIRPTLAAER